MLRVRGLPTTRNRKLLNLFKNVLTNLIQLKRCYNIYHEYETWPKRESLFILKYNLLLASGIQPNKIITVFSVGKLFRFTTYTFLHCNDVFFLLDCRTSCALHLCFFLWIAAQMTIECKNCFNVLHSNVKYCTF